MTVLPALLVFIGVFLVVSVAVVIAAYWQDRGVAPAPAASAFPADLPVLLKEEVLSSISFWEGLLKHLDVVDSLKHTLTESGLKWSVGRVTATMMLTGIILAALVSELPWLPSGTSIVAFGVGAFIPYLFVLSQRRRRFEKFEQQFPDALDSMARALRAGHAFAGALEILAQEAPQPIGAEIKRIVDEYKLGSSWNIVLTGFAERIPLLEIRLFVAAVLLQNRTGGKLTEVLERLAETIRDSISLRGDVKAIAAHGRLTGTVLTLLPIGIAITMYNSSPGYLEILTVHPLGPSLIAGAIVCLGLGHFTIKRIVAIKV